VREKAGAIAEGGFDLVWLPPHSFDDERSAGQPEAALQPQQQL
jgi:hypothetical protein